MSPKILYSLIILSFNIHRMFLLPPQQLSKRISPQQFTDLSKRSEEMNVNNLIEDILSSMDTSVDPCQNYYQYACGGWVAKNLDVVKTKQPFWDRYLAVTQENAKIMKNVLESKAASNNSALSKAKGYYQSCMEARNDPMSKTPIVLMQFLKNLKEKNLQTKLEVIVVNLGLPAFFQLIVDEDDIDTSKNIVYLKKGSLILGKAKKYVNSKNQLSNESNKTLVAYRTYISNYSSMLNDIFGRKVTTIDKFQFDTLAHDIIKLETDLAKAMTDLEADPIEMTPAEMDIRYPFVNWTQIFDAMAKTTSFKIKNINQVRVDGPDYMDNLNEIFEKYKKDEQSMQMLDEYLYWYVADEMLKYLPTPYKKTKVKLAKMQTGVNNATYKYPNWQSCVSETEKVLGHLTASLLIKETFPPQNKLMINEMVDEIQAVFMDNIKSQAWVNPKVVKDLIKKAENLGKKIGFPDFIMDLDKLDQEFRQLKIEPKNYMANMINGRSFAQSNLYKTLDDTPEEKKKKWGMIPSTMNAYYSFSENEIVLPAALFQIPFFSQDYPTAVNYGAIGALVGHEMYHSFDTTGIQYDLNGQRKVQWDNKTVAQFLKKTKCFQNQYSVLQNLPKVNTIDEDIADNGGLAAAYKAYLNKQNKLKRTDDGYPFEKYNITSDQLFFLSFAQSYCHVADKAYSSNSLKYGEHSPHDIRVIGPLSNFQQFSAAYQCPDNSPMNPKLKCNLW